MKRRAISVSGIVQGVGFRPFVHRLAGDLKLSGFVRNRVGDVEIEVEGDLIALEAFIAGLRELSPPSSRIDHISWHQLPAQGHDLFRIESSQNNENVPAFFPPDLSTCDECLHELFDPNDRRYQYPFLNCTNCGPRLTIVRGAPYDRERTTMADFELCDKCRQEYDDPTDRRFHAQPNACPDCGPRLTLLDSAGNALDSDNPIKLFAGAVLNGAIGALKGVGGFHLVCDARSDAIVHQLRIRKHRDEKAFAVMVADLEAVKRFCQISPEEEKLLISPRRPIVLLRKHATCTLAESVAAGNPYLGVMLPYAPIHHLLMKAVGNVPLVMTSGNRSDEPMVYQNANVVDRLQGITDLILTNNRPIHIRCDDSVTRVVGGWESPIRRSRGDAPQPIPLTFECVKPILAVGGQMKTTFALGCGQHAFVSHHIGDLDHFRAYQAYEHEIALYESLFNISPQVIVHDLHPDYQSTRYAHQRSNASPSVGKSDNGIMMVAVQHHYAHMASCMAEHGLCEPVIGVTFDGTGFGTDGTIWGGEFLIGDYGTFQRAAHLRNIGMPGGTQAIKEPWRMATAYLHDAGIDANEVITQKTDTDINNVLTMLNRGINTPQTSSAGRLFDAVASICGLRDISSYEGQAAIELEWLAIDEPECGDYPFSVHQDSESNTLVIDTRPIIEHIARDVVDGCPVARIARRFHTTVVNMICDVCVRLHGAGGPEAVVLSGGVFMNTILIKEVEARLKAEGLRVYRHQLVPPNDGGLSLGQLAIAAEKIIIPDSAQTRNQESA